MTKSSISPPEPEPLWTLEDLARVLKCSLRALRRARARGESLPPNVSMTCSYRCRPEAVAAWLEARERAGERRLRRALVGLPGRGR